MMQGAKVGDCKCSLTFFVMRKRRCNMTTTVSEVLSLPFKCKGRQNLLYSPRTHFWKSNNSSFSMEMNLRDSFPHSVKMPKKSSFESTYRFVEEI